MAANNTIPFEQFDTVLGDDVHIEGELTAAEDAIVGGTIVGTLQCTKMLHLLGTAAVQTRVTAQNCTLYGARVDGELAIAQRLKLYRGSQVSGKIATAVIDVESGAMINATVKMQVEDGRRKARAAKPRK